MTAALITDGLAASILFPLFGALLLALSPTLGERAVGRISLFMAWLSSVTSILAIAIWIAGGASPFRTADWTLASHGEYQFTLGLVLNAAAAVFLVLVQFTSGMVMRFSRVYMHREPGFRRFFAIVLIFQGAMCLLTLAGNLDLLFVGWEMVGLASFLLIAFYHERHSSVRNALKTFSIYRVADVGMLLGAYLEHTSGRTGIGLLLLLAAAGKSAQFPFSFWIVRAMEGPTPSSALFYGALSVHAGAYLLLRTYPIWGDVTAVHVCVALVGLVTALLCTLFSRVQHTIKGQVGYASVTQVGLIFVELALGLKWLALLHMVGNALLRCYQLLVSPSAVAYLLRQQSSLAGVRASDERSLSRRLLPQGLRSTLYVFAISEGYLEKGFLGIFWIPMRVLGAAMSRSRAPLLAIGLGTAVAAAFARRGIGDTAALALGSAVFVTAIAFSVSALSSWQSPMRSFSWVSLSCAGSALAVFVASQGRDPRMELGYICAVGLSSALALGGAFSALPSGVSITRLAGLGQAHPLAAASAFAGVLGIMGFPLLPTFFGEDMLLHGAFQVHRVFAVALSALFAFNGYLAMRSFAFAFFGRSPPRHGDFASAMKA